MKRREYRKSQYPGEKWCSRCKETDIPLMKHSKNEYGQYYYLCKKCNNELATSYYHRILKYDKEKIKAKNKKAKERRKLK